MCPILYRTYTVYTRHPPTPHNHAHVIGAQKLTSVHGTLLSPPCTSHISDTTHTYYTHTCYSGYSCRHHPYRHPDDRPAAACCSCAARSRPPLLPPSSLCQLSTCLLACLYCLSSTGTTSLSMPCTVSSSTGSSRRPAAACLRCSSLSSSLTSATTASTSRLASLTICFTLWRAAVRSPSSRPYTTAAPIAGPTTMVGSRSSTGAVSTPTTGSARSSFLVQCTATQPRNMPAP
mmetsp:Transcript_16333/g.40691  ORF Transcript_16333/g.40691 Transcript_16333/m.40691 type:complete len:233 (-) Transcript_16333:152-850(-)